LLQGFLAYLASGNEEEAIAEARSQGYEYAARGRRYHLTHIEAVHAFLFFRNALLSALVDVYVDSRVSDAEVWREMVQRFRVFTDEVLISLLETYEAFESASSSP
jgi:c-di-GMP-related signal transduction protein